MIMINADIVVCLCHVRGVKCVNGMMLLISITNALMHSVKGVGANLMFLICMFAMFIVISARSVHFVLTS